MAIEAAQKCFKCGRALAPRAPEGLCRRCVASSLLATEMEEAEPLGIAGRRFGDYELIEEIARGGMGVVYRARQVSLNRNVALKMILAGQIAGRDALRMFRREAQAAANLHHPNIVPVFEIGEHELQDYFTMRLVAGGKTISDWAATQRGDWKAIAAAVAKAARAVAHAHAHGVLHRDLKPSNILWDDQAGPQVTDFGLAKLLDEVDPGHTRSGHAMGSPGYMAPEQTGGRADEITTATDVYGLGAVLYEVISGAPPFSGTSAIETMRRAAEETPAPPGNAPTELQTVCLKCLAKAQEDRYRSAAGLADDLERFARGEPVSAVPLTSAQTLWRWAQRRPRIATLIGFTVAIFFAAVIGVTWAWRNAEVSRRGESTARENATATVVDLYTQSGLGAAREGEMTRAALWFAKAAESATDPARRRENLSRQAVWRNETHTAVRAFQSEIGPIRWLYWNAAGTALIGLNWNSGGGVWDVQAGTRWLPKGLEIDNALWANNAAWFAHGGGGFVRLTEYPSGREVARVAYTGRTPTLALSADDAMVAVGGENPFIWEIASGVVRTLPKNLGTPRGLEFSGDGSLVLLCATNQVGIVAVAESERFVFPPTVCHHLTATPGFLGTNHFYSSATNGIVVQDVRTGAVVEVYSCGDENTGCIPRYGSADGKYVATTRSAVLVRPAGFSNVPVHGNTVEQADFSADVTMLATACHDSIVRLTRLPAGPEWKIGVHQESAAGAAISPDKRFVATSQGGANLVRVWKVGGPPVSRKIPASRGAAFRLSKDGQSILPTGLTHWTFRMERTRVHSVETGEPIGPEIVPGGAIMDGDFLPDSSLAVLASSGRTNRRDGSFAQEAGPGTVQFWNYKSGVRDGESIDLKAEPRGLAVHPTGRWVAVFTARRDLIEIDVAARTARVLHEGDRGHDAGDLFPNGRCRYSPDGRFIVAWGMRSRAVVWDRETESLVDAPGDGWDLVTDVDFDGGIMAMVDFQSRASFWALPTMAAAREPLRETERLFVGRFDDKGELFLTAGRNKMARVWDWRSGVAASPTLRHDMEVFAGAFLKRSEVVACGGMGGIVHFWDRKTGLPARPNLPLGNVLDLATTLDGRKLIVGDSGDGSIQIYDVAALLPELPLPIEDALLLAEIDAAAEIKNGALEPLTAVEWLKKWRALQARQPGWHDRLFP